MQQGMSPETWQLVVLGLNAMWGVVLLMVGVLLKYFLTALRDVEKNLSKLNDAVLKGYATRDDVESVRIYSREKYHELSDGMHYHEVGLALLSQHVKFTLPMRK